MPLTPLDFPASPTVGQTYPDPPVTGQPTYQWDGAQWLSKFALGKEYVPLDGSVAMTGLLTLSGDAVNPLHAVPKQQLDAGLLRSNYAQKNYIINGAMMVSQEYANTAVGGTGNYPVDMFQWVHSNAATQISQQVASGTPGGSTNRLRLTISTADTSVAAGDFLQLRYTIEGYRMAGLKAGTAAAKTVTLQFGCKGPAGTYCVAFINSLTNRFYIAEYTITAGEANTDVVKSITLTLDTTGTWGYINDIGLDIRFVFMMGTTFHTATPNTWIAPGSPVIATANQFNFAGSTSNVFELFDVSLTEDSVAPPFQVPDYASELAACQRYFYNGTRPIKGVVGPGQPWGSRMGCPHPVPMRASPTVTLTSQISLTEGTTVTTTAGVQTNYSTAIALEFDSLTANALTTGRALVASITNGGNISVNARL